VARLVIVQGKNAGASVELGKTALAVGRLASCELPIDEPQASRRHFEVEARGPAVYVKDLGSKNGTYLNEGRVDGEARLSHGDKLRVGTTVVAFETEAAPFAAKARIGPYELGAELGRREGLTLHDGRHVALARNVVIEMLDAGDPGAPVFLERARAAATYAHPALLAVYDVDEHEGRAYRVREVMEHSRDLEVRIREGKLAPSFALGVAQQVAAGLAHMHERGGVHGWLTPRTILVGELATVKLEVVSGDKLLRLDPERSDARLQMLSISPEEARGLDPTPKSDVYALGCILYRALSGTAPYEGDLSVVIRGHASEQPVKALAKLAPELEGEIDELVGSLLAKRADGRPSALELSVSLGGLAARAPSTAEPPRAKAPAPAWGNKAELRASAETIPMKARPPVAEASPPPKVKTGSKSRPEPKPASDRVAPEKPAPAPKPPSERVAPERAAPEKPAPPQREEPEEASREILRWRRFDPIRGALLGVVLFFLFFLAAEGTRLALRFLRPDR
jgi:pSer/pThr/pTyr-binding forkhead associated (FHA) protein